ncbi:hypothetical protein F5Y15DRAFT_373081 [Xylariaceae sp. FL0016]|nr:hypothetical protein F5Y15DRAFT_373081 [Xylariaceae sp. FL0016]
MSAIRHDLPADLSFFILPPEIRLKVYENALSWPDLATCFSSWQCDELEEDLLEDKRACEGKYAPRSSVDVRQVLPQHYTTPSCLLLCRQITHEALPVLYAQPLHISKPTPYSQLMARPLDITHFISELALQRAQHVVLEMDLERASWSWTRVVDTLLDVWHDANSLRKLDVVVDLKKDMPRSFTKLRTEGNLPPTHDLRIVAKLTRFGMTVPVEIRRHEPEP